MTKQVKQSNNKQAKKHFKYNDIYAIEDELFQLALRSYTLGNSSGVDELVSSSGIKKKIYRLMESIDAFVINDTMNKLLVRVYLEQYSYNHRSRKALARFSVHSSFSGKKDIKEDDKIIFKSIECGDELDTKPCALSVFESLLGAMESIASKQYFKILKDNGVKIEAYYGD